MGSVWSEVSQADPAFSQPRLVFASIPRYYFGFDFRMRAIAANFMKKTRILLSDSTDPWFNLAVEDTIFRSMPADERVLFLWRNADTVVIGRSQNPWRECKTDRMEQDHIKLARRQTGGGAVFHDLGNTNFTFMAARPEYDKKVSTQIVLDGLARLGIHGVANGRNDLVVEDELGIHKFSGSAYRETFERGFHHGTLLLSADLNRLANYLNPDEKKLKAKGITSVKSRVINLDQLKPDIHHAEVCDAIMAAYQAHYGIDVAPEFISPDHFHNLPGFEEKFARQSSWDWNWGLTPPFTHDLDERFGWGGVQVLLDVQSGIIQQATIYTDALDPAPLETLAERLHHLPYRSQAIETTIEQLIQQYPQDQDIFGSVGHWLKAKIE